MNDSPVGFRTGLLFVDKVVDMKCLSFLPGVAKFYACVAFTFFHANVLSVFELNLYSCIGLLYSFSLLSATIEKQDENRPYQCLYIHYSSYFAPQSYKKALKFCGVGEKM